MTQCWSSLQDISDSFFNIKTQIEELVNDNVLTQVESYATECLINSENLTKYAEDENQANLAAAHCENERTEKYFHSHCGVSLKYFSFCAWVVTENPTKTNADLFNVTEMSICIKSEV